MATAGCRSIIFAAIPFAAVLAAPASSSLSSAFAPAGPLLPQPRRHTAASCGCLPKSGRSFRVVGGHVGVFGRGVVVVSPFRRKRPPAHRRGGEGDASPLRATREPREPQTGGGGRGGNRIGSHVIGSKKIADAYSVLGLVDPTTATATAGSCYSDSRYGSGYGSVIGSSYGVDGRNGSNGGSGRNNGAAAPPQPQITEKEIREAYRRQARKSHPDAVLTESSTAEERKRVSDDFAKINEAYELLRHRDDDEEKEKSRKKNPFSSNARSSSFNDIGVQSADRRGGGYYEGNGNSSRGGCYGDYDSSSREHSHGYSSYDGGGSNNFSSYSPPGRAGTGTGTVKGTGTNKPLEPVFSNDHRGAGGGKGRNSGGYTSPSRSRTVRRKNIYSSDEGGDGQFPPPTFTYDSNSRIRDEEATNGEGGFTQPSNGRQPRGERGVHPIDVVARKASSSPARATAAREKPPPPPSSSSSLRDVLDRRSAAAAAEVKEKEKSERTTRSPSSPRSSTTIDVVTRKSPSSPARAAAARKKPSSPPPPSSSSSLRDVLDRKVAAAAAEATKKEKSGRAARSINVVARKSSSSPARAPARKKPPPPSSLSSASSLRDVLDRRSAAEATKKEKSKRALRSPSSTTSRDAHGRGTTAPSAANASRKLADRAGVRGGSPPSTTPTTKPSMTTTAQNRTTPKRVVMAGKTRVKGSGNEPSCGTNHGDALGGNAVRKLADQVNIKSKTDAARPPSGKAAIGAGKPAAAHEFFSGNSARKVADRIKKNVKNNAIPPSGNAVTTSTGRSFSVKELADRAMLKNKDVVKLAGTTGKVATNASRKQANRVEIRSNDVIDKPPFVKTATTTLISETKGHEFFSGNPARKLADQVKIKIKKVTKPPTGTSAMTGSGRSFSIRQLADRAKLKGGNVAMPSVTPGKVVTTTSDGGGVVFSKKGGGVNRAKKLADGIKIKSDVLPPPLSSPPSSFRVERARDDGNGKKEGVFASSLRSSLLSRAASAAECVSFDGVSSPPSSSIRNDRPSSSPRRRRSNTTGHKKDVYAVLSSPTSVASVTSAAKTDGSNEVASSSSPRRRRSSTTGHKENIYDTAPLPPRMVVPSVDTTKSGDLNGAASTPSQRRRSNSIGQKEDVYGTPLSPLPRAAAPSANSSGSNDAASPFSPRRWRSISTGQKENVYDTASSPRPRAAVPAADATKHSNLNKVIPSSSRIWSSAVRQKEDVYADASPPSSIFSGSTSAASSERRMDAHAGAGEMSKEKEKSKPPSPYRSAPSSSSPFPPDASRENKPSANASATRDERNKEKTSFFKSSSFSSAYSSTSSSSSSPTSVPGESFKVKPTTAESETTVSGGSKNTPTTGTVVDTIAGVRIIHPRRRASPAGRSFAEATSGTDVTSGAESRQAATDHIRTSTHGRRVKRRSSLSADAHPCRGGNFDDDDERHRSPRTFRGVRPENNYNESNERRPRSSVVVVVAAASWLRRVTTERLNPNASMVARSFSRKIRERGGRGAALSDRWSDAAAFYSTTEDEATRSASETDIFSTSSSFSRGRAFSSRRSSSSHPRERNDRRRRYPIEHFHRPHKKTVVVSAFLAILLATLLRRWLTGRTYVFGMFGSKYLVVFGKRSLRQRITAIFR